MPPEQDSLAPTEQKGNEPAKEESASLPITDADNEATRSHLGISDEVWDKISKPVEATKEEPPPEEPPKEEQPTEEAPKEEPQPEAEPVAAEKEDDDEHEKVTAETKPDKIQKRIDRLTRQKRERDEKIEELEAQLAEVTAEKKVVKPTEVPKSTAQTEAEKELAAAEQAIAWCEANPEGGTTIQGDKEVFLDADQIARLKRFSEKDVLRLAPEVALAKRDARKQYEAERTQFDGLAKQEWPEIFDKSKEEYQVAQTILSIFPEITNSPRANYAVGLAIEGIKALNARKQSKPNGEKKHRDISERAFEPRVPIAPSTAAPPSRNDRPSPTKQYDQAFERLVTEGGRENLVAALEAMDAQNPKTGPHGKRLVET